MELDEYVSDDEEVLEQAAVYQGTNALSDDYRGTLACTPRRAVFVSGGEVTDISLRAVNAIEYRVPGIPWKHIGIAAVLLIVGLLAALVAQFVEASGVVPFAVGIPAVIAVVIIAVGVYLRRYQVRIHTPGEAFTFEAKVELDDIAQAIRAQEAER